MALVNGLFLVDSRFCRVLATFRRAGFVVFVKLPGSIRAIEFMAFARNSEEGDGGGREQH